MVNSVTTRQREQGESYKYKELPQRKKDNYRGRRCSNFGLSKEEAAKNECDQLLMKRGSFCKQSWCVCSFNDNKSLFYNVCGYLSLLRLLSGECTASRWACWQPLCHLTGTAVTSCGLCGAHSGSSSASCMLHSGTTLHLQGTLPNEVCHGSEHASDKNNPLLCTTYIKG